MSGAVVDLAQAVAVRNVQVMIEAMPSPQRLKVLLDVLAAEASATGSPAVFVGLLHAALRGRLGLGCGGASDANG